LIDFVERHGLIEHLPKLPFAAVHEGITEFAEPLANRRLRPLRSRSEQNAPVAKRGVYAGSQKS
jgi:hypothetical protein